MINKVILVGRLTKDVEVRKTTSGISTASFTVACNRRGRNDQGGQSADFINCVAWRQSADFLGNYAKKGSIVGIEGRITTRNYERQNGRVYVTEVTCENVQLIGGSRGAQDTSERHEPVAYDVKDDIDDELANTPSFDISSDDLPFY